jgi:hypothetical protein
MLATSNRVPVEYTRCDEATAPMQSRRGFGVSITRRIMGYRITFISVIALAMLVGVAATATAKLEVIVSSGDLSPDGNGQLSSINAPSLNDAGTLAFVADLVNTAGGAADNAGFFRHDSNGLALLARRGDSFDNRPINVFFPTSSYIDDFDRVSGVMALSTPTVLRHFRSEDGPPSLIYSTTDPSPSGNNTFLGVTTLVLNGAGVATYQAVYSGVSPEVGLYTRAIDGTVTTRALRNSTAPRGGAINSLGTRFTMNESTQIGTVLGVDVGEEFVESVSRIDGTTILEFLREGDVLTGSNKLITEITSAAPMINDAGQVAFAANYEEPAWGQGVFLADESGVQLIASGFPSTSFTFNDNVRVYGLNSAGTVAFTAELGAGADPPSGVYLADADGPTQIASEDTATPVAGKFFRQFFHDTTTLNEAGQVAFLAELSDTANGSAAGRGLYIYDPLDGLQEVARSGDALAGSTINSIFFVGTSLTATSQSPDESMGGLNNLGQVAFAYSLANGQEGIAIWSPDVDLPGDFNHDGSVDAADYTVWRDNATGEFTPADYGLWKENFGRASTETPASGSSSGAVSIPEPAALLLALLGSSLLLTSRARCAFPD